MSLGVKGIKIQKNKISKLGPKQSIIQLGPSSVSEWVTNMNTSKYEREYEYEQIRNTNMYISTPKMIDVLEK